MIERSLVRRASAATVRARRAPLLESLEHRHLMAGWSPVGPETLVNDTTAGIQETTFEGGKAVASDDNGGYVVVWSGSGPGDADGVYARLYNASGALGPAFRANSTIAGVQTEAAVAMDNSGRFIVVWSSSSQDGSGWGIFGQRYNSAGNPQGAEFQVNTVTTAGHQYQPSIAADADGDFVVTWTSDGLDGRGLGIAAQRFNVSAVPQGGEIHVNAYTDGDQLLSAVAMDDAGAFTVVWQSDYTVTGSIGIFSQRFNASGGTIGSWSVVNTTTAGFQLAPSIGMNGAGAYVVAWTSDSQDGNGRGVFAQRHTAAGAKTGPEFQVNATTVGDQQDPSVAVDAGGAFVVAWESAAQDASGWGVYAREYTASGVAVGAEFRLNTTTAGDQSDVVVATVGGGDFVAAWRGNGAGDDSGVFLQRYEDLAAGVTVTPTAGLVTSESGATADFTVVLNSRPTANVTISIASSDTTEGTVSTASLTFTRNNWNVPQTVTVTGVNDALSDGDVAYAIQTGAASSSDADYGGLAVADVAVINTDTTPPPNAPPAVTASAAALQYEENAGAVAIDPGLTVTDANDATLAGAVVAIDGYIAGEDLLEFAGAPGITGSWDGVAGTLTVSGIATVAEYQAALRAVTYRNTSDNPGVAGRSVRFVVNDGQADSTPAARGVSVNAVNDPPGAADETFAGEQDAVLSVPAASGVLVNDADVDGGALAAVLVQQAANGTVQLFADGSFTYTPDAGFWGTDQFVYSASDGAGGSDTATVTIQVARGAGVTVTPTSGLTTTDTGGQAVFTVVLDRAPTADVTINLSSSDATEGAVSVPSLTFTTANWATPQTVTLSGVNDGVPEGAVAYTVVTSAAVSADPRYSNLAVADVSAVNVSGSVAGGGLRGTYFDNDDFTGPRISRLDPVVNFNWANASPEPAIAPDTFSVRWTGEIRPRFGESYTFHTTSDDGVRLWVNGVLIINNWTDHGSTVDAGTLMLAADQWYSVVMEAYDNTGEAVARLEWSSASQAREVVPPTRLRPANAVPTAQADAYGVVGGSSISVAGPGVLANDTDADSDRVAASLANGPSHGSVVLNADGSFTYTPAAGYVGSDSFVYSIDDGWGGTDSATVTIDVTPPPAIIVSPTSGLTTSESGGTASFTVVLTRQPTASVRIDLLSAGGEGNVSATSLVFDPSDWNVPQAVTVAGVDDGVDDADQTYTITLAPAVSADPLYDGLDAADVSVTNRANPPRVPLDPVAAADFYRVVSGDVLTLIRWGVLANDLSPSGLPLSVSLLRPAVHGTVLLFPDGGLVYTPESGYFGTDRFSYTVTDGNGSAAADVTIVIEPPLPAEPGPGPQPGGQTPPIVLPVPKPPLSAPALESNGEDDGESPPAEKEDPPVVVAPPTPTPPPPPTVNVAVSNHSTELKVAKPVGRVSGGRTAAPPTPAARVIPRAATRDESQDGSDNPPELADHDPGRVPLPRIGSGPDYGSLKSTPSAALMTAVGPLATKLEAMSRQIGADERSQNATVRTVSQAALAMTAGYVLWSLRGVSLVASLLTSLPLWRSLDPLPILEGRADRDKAKAAVKRRKKARRGSDPGSPGGAREDDEKLKSMVN